MLLLCLQHSIASPFHMPDASSQHLHILFVYDIFNNTTSSNPMWLVPFNLSTKILYAFRFSPKPVTCHAHHFLYLVITIISGKGKVRPRTGHEGP